MSEKRAEPSRTATPSTDLPHCASPHLLLLPLLIYFDSYVTRVFSCLPSPPVLIFFSLIELHNVQGYVLQLQPAKEVHPAFGQRVSQ